MLTIQTIRIVAILSTVLAPALTAHLPESTHILTPKGVKPLSALMASNEAVTCLDLGDSASDNATEEISNLQTTTGEISCFHWSAALIGPLIEIETIHGSFVVGRLQKIYVLGNVDAMREGLPGFVPAHDLRPGDILYSALHGKCVCKYTEEVRPNKRLSIYEMILEKRELPYFISDLQILARR